MQEQMKLSDVPLVDQTLEAPSEVVDEKAQAEKPQPRKYEPRDTDNQRVFDHVIPRLLEQGRCWAPGYGNRYELPPGYFWTGERYQSHTVLLEDPSTGKQFGPTRSVTKFAGDRVYRRCNYSRFDPIRMIFVDRPQFHRLQWKMFYQDIFSENTTCDSGKICGFLERLGFHVGFLRALQQVHDDLSLNTKEDWMKEFDRVSVRFGLERGTNRGPWLDLNLSQEWDYDFGGTEAIKIAMLRV